MTEAYVIAATMIPFGRYPDHSTASLGNTAVMNLLQESGVAPKRIEAVHVGRSYGGAIDGQVAVPGQVALRETGITDLPVTNFDNACAAVPTALHYAAHAVTSGQYELILVLGMDKLYARERRKSMAALVGGMDVREAQWMLESDVLEGSVFMEHYYGRVAREYLEHTDATPTDLANVAVKNREHAALNPYAQYRDRLSVDAVLGAPMVAEPLTKLMCSPLTDGSAAMLVCSRSFLHKYKDTQTPGVRVASCTIRSGQPDGQVNSPVLERTAGQAYEEAGIGPEDIDFAEVHEASAPGELIATEELGLCASGEGARLIREGASRLGGRVPVNVSGGLLSRGHPGAGTGGGQLVELVWQLQGRCGARQVDGARVGLAHSSGGLVGAEPASTAVTVLVGEK